jgi:hypothetical protein
VLYSFLHLFLSFLDLWRFSLFSSFVEWIGGWTKTESYCCCFREVHLWIWNAVCHCFQQQSWLATDFLPKFFFHHRRFVTAAGMMYTISLSTCCLVYSITNSIISSKVSVQVRSVVLYFRNLDLITVCRSNKWQFIRFHLNVSLSLMLRPTVSRPVCLGIKHHSGAYVQIFIIVWQLWVFWFGAPSLTRGRVRRLQLQLALASAAVFGSESRRTRDHILLSQIWDFPFRRLLRLAGSRWRYSIHLNVSVT